ncbi:GATA transcription factor 1 [Morus notabilis]|uniref:GATA transcription factor 1 n=1 Tax=Morus notabilis TaxID=981085 RepID=UPI000CED5404|nr:GATA transcription factor 1 [Morus notabilis]XP_024021769.1 GATA transcription factor 1 [Morus notabilis]XP_024021770.1 GATA transcription factor 1 [Morus notabilis]
MESLDSEPCFVDELLNFSSDMDEEDDNKPRKALASSLRPNGLLGPAGDSVRPFHELVEEELEWISNKDAFPAVESFVGILPDNPSGAILKHHSPVSVLDGGSGGSSTISCNSNSNCSNSSSSIATLTSCFSSLKAPRRARSKRRCRRRGGDITGRQLCWSQANNNNNNESFTGYEKATRKTTTMTTTIIGRKCQHCGADKTPQWRAGPYGPKTLCNACGVRYKSGRLVSEYRPASSPTFSSELHSNSHRKILEMRRTKQMMGMVVKHPLESG